MDILGEHCECDPQGSLRVPQHDHSRTSWTADLLGWVSNSGKTHWSASVACTSARFWLTTHTFSPLNLRMKPSQHRDECIELKMQGFTRRHSSLLAPNLRCLRVSEAAGRLLICTPSVCSVNSQKPCQQFLLLFAGPPSLFLSSCRPFPPAQLLLLLITRMSKSLLSARHNRLCCTLLSPYSCFCFFEWRTV